MSKKLPGKFHRNRVNELCRLCSDGLILMRGEIDWFRKRALRMFDSAYCESNFKQEKNLYYLTGIEVPNSFVLIETETAEVHLYTDWESDYELAHVKELGLVRDIHPTKEFLSDVHEKATNYEALYTLYSSFYGDGYLGKITGVLSGIFPPGMGEPVGDDLQFAQQLQGMFPGLRIKNLDNIVKKMRRIKHPEEIKILKRVNEISVLAVLEAIRGVFPGRYDHELAGLIEYTCYQQGASRSAFPANLMSGPNAVTPIFNLWSDYTHRDRQMQDGDSIIINIGTEYNYYQCVIGRSVPVSGKFTKRQKSIHDLYLSVYLFTLDKLKAGRSQLEMKNICLNAMKEELKKIKKAYLRDIAEMFIGINTRRPALGHYVDMSTVGEGAMDDEPIEAGMVFSLEPLMFDFETSFSVFIANTILVQENGYAMLSKGLPFETGDIEKIMSEPCIWDNKSV